MKTVGAFEAKTHLSSLLDRVAKGERITITRRGVPVAVLVPAMTESHKLTADEAIHRMRAMRERHRLDGTTVRELIEEGRRF
jgi:prevent-host-death family protein